MLTPQQIDYVPLTHAVHRLSGIVSAASAAYSAAELQHQLASSNATALFTCLPLLENALKAARAHGLSDDRIFRLNVPGTTNRTPFATADALIADGQKLPALAPLKWTKGQGARQTAFLCYSSGTSGQPVRVFPSTTITTVTAHPEGSCRD